MMQSQLFNSLSACTSAGDTAVIDAAAETFEVMLGEPHKPPPYTPRPLLPAPLSRYSQVSGAW